ncbi:hypothetical protein V5F53_09745 [Xanthobacter sp. V4C-4]|uniref:hypothetical protein n=1 Tax=Xanthobacter cornucopiae TaxID=3119924 RepID=UPI00372A3B0E
MSAHALSPQPSAPSGTHPDALAAHSRPRGARVGPSVLRLSLAARLALAAALLAPLWIAVAVVVR